MSLTVLLDFEDSPAAFSWTGPIAHEVLERWLARQADRSIPADLITLWRTVGGGDLFESETILEPFASPSADDIDGMNEHLRSRGMPSNLLAFHVGICVSAVDQASGVLVQLDPESLGEQARFSTFDGWYRTLIRSEYAERYGLADEGR
ncbi:MAG: hypothetical protein GY701_15865 [Sulfitobacter sp.]|nr:hypothetical protein [Sulfitobacter sp.]